MATELGKAYVQIVPSAKGIAGSISNVLKGESVSAGQSAGLNIAGAIKNALVAGGIGVALKKSLDAGGDLQQSLGGLETLYGSAAASMKEMSEAAAQAGIDSNTYAEQAVSFGASLKQAYGGDVVAAAKAADTAILDMADNSAKMGTDIASIQTAYQGFAKQNYTMLDNLKLGYGGTKGEMERLLADAEKLSGVHYDIDNLGDVYSAIHVIQDDLGLTGVAADEAKTTFTGSMQAMKASATNLLAHLSMGEDITKDFEALVGNVRVFLTGNLLPMVLNIVKSLPTLLQSAWGELYTAGMDLLGNLTQGIQDNLPTMIENGLNALLSFTSTLHDNAGDLIDAGLSMIQTLAQALIDSLPVMIETIPTIVSNIANIINDNMPKIIETGINLIKALIQGLFDALPVLIANLPQIIKAIFDVFAAVNWLDIGASLITDIGNGIKGLFSLIPDLFRSLCQKAWDTIRSIDWYSLGASVVNFIANGIKGLVSIIPNALRNIATNAFNAFKSIDWLGLGANIVQGIANGIINGAGAIVSAAKNAAMSAFNSAKETLGIHSPSRLFRDEVGAQISAGIALGISDNVDAIADAMQYASDTASSEFTTGQYTVQSDSRMDEVLKLLLQYLPECAQRQVLTDSSFIDGVNQRLGMGVVL